MSHDDAENIVTFPRPLRAFIEAYSSQARPEIETAVRDEALFYQHVLDAQVKANLSSAQSLEALRTFVFALLDGTVAEPFANLARSAYLSFVDAERFPLRSDFNAIISSLTEVERDTLLNGFWHRGELVQLLSPARIATLALKCSRQ